MKYIDQVVLFFKVVLFVFIILSPVINYKPVASLNTVYFKITMLALIAALCFIDFQLGLIAMIAFMILVINLNQKVFDGFDSSDGRMVMPGNVLCDQNVRTDINQDLFNLYIDDKIKPYEVFVKMLTNESALEKVQGAEL